jgi:hypothetical protein
VRSPVIASPRSTSALSRRCARVGAVALSLGLAGLVVAACGFEGEGALGASVGAPEPDASTSPSLPAQPDPAPGGDAADASVDVLPCTDPTLAFDGDDYVSVPAQGGLDLSGDFTVEAWIKPGAKANATPAVAMDIVSHHDPFTSISRGWVLLVDGGRVEIVVWGSDSLGPFGYSAGNAGAKYVVAGKWAHVAGTLQGTTLRIYYDGVLRDTQELGVSFTRAAFTGDLRIGRAAYGDAARFEGEIDDIRLSTVARYTGPTAPRPTAPLPIDATTEASWRFDEPSGTTVIDSTNKSHDGTLGPDASAPTRKASPCIVDR